MAEKIFLGGPFTKKLNHQRLFDPEAEQGISLLLQALRAGGYTVYSAHNREDFGRSLDKPSSAVAWDFDKIRESDMFIAVLDETLTEGTAAEIGFCIGIGKPVMLVFKGLDEVAKRKHKFFISGVRALTNVQSVDV